MRSRRMAACLGAVLAVALVFDTGCSREEYKRQFRENYVRSFMPTCTHGAMQEGMGRKDSEKVCRCMAERLVAELSTDELTEMGLRQKPSPEAEKIMTECGEKIGAEIRDRMN